jgi:branched-chain amino acid transport system ATP-binding protein
MGRNGMGKSTDSQHAGARQAADDGEVRVRGSAMTATSPTHRPPGHCVRAGGSGHLSESHGAREPRDAARAGPDGRRDWTYERALSTFPRLAERLDHGGWQLTGGEQQMLTIAVP